MMYIQLQKSVIVNETAIFCEGNVYDPELAWPRSNSCM